MYEFRLEVGLRIKQAPEVLWAATACSIDQVAGHEGTEAPLNGTTTDPSLGFTLVHLSRHNDLPTVVLQTTMASREGKGTTRSEGAKALSCKQATTGRANNARTRMQVGI